MPFNNLTMVINTEETIKMENLMEEGSTSGKMGPLTKDFSWMEVFMKGNGAEGFQMEKVLNMLTKQGMFKAKG